MRTRHGSHGTSRIWGARMRVLAVLMGLVSGCKSEGGASTSTGSTSTTGAASTGEATDAAGTTAVASSESGAPTTGGPDLPPARACNGDAALCERRFDEVVFPCTHNAFAARDDGFAQINANQQHGVAQQLADGVRCMMLDVQDNAGQTSLCHGGCALGELAHLDVLIEIADFLEQNPDEVLTIIYQDDIASDRIVADLEESGLSQRVYTHEAGSWPTLATMIDDDTRLLVTAESGGPPPAWFHHVWDLTWDTPYTFHAVEEFTCALNRGSAGNDLFLVNHWLSTMFDTPSQPDAKIANAYEVLHGRAVQCQTEAKQLPNFLAVDFYDEGDLFAVVRALNGLP